MNHHHHHHEPKYNKAFTVGILLNLGFIIVEVIYGLQTGSLALLADAGHNASDVLGLVIAWIATWLASKKATEKYTYGLQSSSIIAAIINATILLGAVAIIAWQAIQRLFEPSLPVGDTVMAVAAIGVLINGITAVMFMRGQKHDLNIRGAFLHMAADAGISFGVLISGFLILQTGWSWLDPVISLAICLIILTSTWDMFTSAMQLALHAVPENIDVPAVKDYLLKLDNVTEIHDLHIWGMSTSEAALSVHLVMPNGHPGDEFLVNVTNELLKRFHISHATIQVEIADLQDCCH